MSSDCGTGSRSVLEWRVPLRFLCTQEEELRRSPGLFLCSCGPGEGAQITPGKKPDKRRKPDASADLSDRAVQEPGAGKRGPQKQLRHDCKQQGGARTPQTRTEQRTERQSDQSRARIPRRRSRPQKGKYRAHRASDRRRSRNREAQDPAAEPAEPEGEALSLDSIDDLVLPGDVDPGEEQQSQRWRITDDGCADWALKKIKLEKDEHDRIVALAQQEIARLKEQIERADRRLEQNTSFLTSMLAEFFETVPHKKTKTGTETYRLLNSQLVKKPGGIKLQPDDEKLVAWLRAAGREDLIKVETKAMWGELKKQIEMVGTVAMMPDTGEIVEGIDVVEVAPAFSVKF